MSRDKGNAHLFSLNRARGQPAGGARAARPAGLRLRGPAAASPDAPGRAGVARIRAEAPGRMPQGHSAGPPIRARDSPEIDRPGTGAAPSSS